MAEKVVITLSEKELVDVLSKHYDLQPGKTTIKFNMGANIPPITSDLITITSDREKQSEVRKNSSSFWDNR